MSAPRDPYREASDGTAKPIRRIGARNLVNSTVEVLRVRLMGGVAVLALVAGLASYAGIYWSGDLGTPSGTIVLYSGADIPAGWELCDGRNGTPDLRSQAPKGRDVRYIIRVRR